MATLLEQHNRLLQHVKQGEMAEINTEVDEVGRKKAFTNHQ
jgi:hypothetical protein